MKTITLSIVLAASIIAIPFQVFASSEVDAYLGIGYGVGEYSAEGVPDFNPSGMVVRFGGIFNRYFAIEGRFGVGLEEDTQNINGVDVSVELDTLMGAYGVGHIYFGKSSSVYGLIGISRVEGTVKAPSIPGATASDNENDLSYGIGVDVGITQSISLNIEYVSYVTKTDLDLSAIGLGAVIRF